jgi:hypothetical protein
MKPWFMIVGLVLAPAALPPEPQVTRPKAPPDAAPDFQIQVGPNVHVSRARATTAHAEVVVAADPKDARRLLAGSIVMPGAPDSTNGLSMVERLLSTQSPLKQLDSVVAYRSSDGGKTWDLALQKEPTESDTGFTDPAVAFGPEGSAYYAAMRRKDGHLELVSSDDGGKSWGPPVRAGDRIDRPFLAVDGTGGKFRGRVYCNCCFLDQKGGRPAFYTSSDKGKTLGPLNSLAGTTKASGGAPGPAVVLSDGTLVLPYKVLIPPAEGGKRLRFDFHFRLSTTGGASFADERSVAIRQYPGENANKPLTPMLAADPGSKDYRDRLYLVWSEMTTAGIRVMCRHSTDRAASWWPPTLISEQTNPKDGRGGTSHYAVVPTVAVNGHGVVGILWYDTRAGADGKPGCHVRFRASADGGETWPPSVRVTEVASHFDIHDRPGGVAPEGWVGDTVGLTADGMGAFHPVWVDNRTGVRQVYTATVTVGGNHRKE